MANYTHGNSTPVTLQDVATHARVGKSTASAVLRGASAKLQIAEATQQRVRQSALELNYRPNAVARGLAKGRMNTLGVLFMSVLDSVMRNIYTAELLEGVLKQGAVSGYNVTIFTQQAHFVHDGRTDGILVVAPSMDSLLVESLAAQRVPLVAISSRTDGLGVPAVDVDNELGARLAVEHLLSLGHMRIAHLMGTLDQWDAALRHETFLRTLEAAGIQTPPEYLAPAKFDNYLAYDETRRLLALPEPPTAIFASNDGLAFAAIRAAADLGISVPGQLSIVGFDDGPMASMSTPMLSTIRHPLTEIGELACSLLIARIEGEEVDAKTHLFPPELVVGQSTGPLL